MRPPQSTGMLSNDFFDAVCIHIYRDIEGGQIFINSYDVWARLCQ